MGLHDWVFKKFAWCEAWEIFLENFEHLKYFERITGGVFWGRGIGCGCSPLTVTNLPVNCNLQMVQRRGTLFYKEAEELEKTERIMSRMGLITADMLRREVRHCCTFGQWSIANLSSRSFNLVNHFRVLIKICLKVF